MKIRLAMLVAVLVASFHAAAEELPCPPPQSTNQEVLSFAQALSGVVHVRVYDERGVLIHEYDHDPSRTQRRVDAFYPENRFVATTASAGCVRGKARRPASSPCVAWFELPRALGPPLRNVVVDAPDGTQLQATLMLAGQNDVQCTMKYENLGARPITSVVSGEQLRLDVRGHLDQSPFRYLYAVNTDVLVAGRDDQPAMRILTDALRAQTNTGQGRAGPSENQLLMAAPRIAVKVRVPK